MSSVSLYTMRPEYTFWRLMWLAKCSGSMTRGSHIFVRCLIGGKIWMSWGVTWTQSAFESSQVYIPWETKGLWESQPVQLHQRKAKFEELSHLKENDVWMLG
jgi:hypothetical protein